MGSVPYNVFPEPRPVRCAAAEFRSRSKNIEYREFRSNFRESAGATSRSLFSLPECWAVRSIAGARRACRESRRTTVGVCPPFRPTFPAFSSPFSPLVPRIDATSCGPAPADVRVASEPRQPWTCRCWLTRLGRLPTRSSYERRGSPLSPSLSLLLYIGTLLQWRLINPLT